MRVLVLGVGYVGLYTALRLSRRSRDVRVTLVSPEPYMTCQPFLPEAAAGSIEPRHAAGDCAAVPDLAGGGLCVPTAQHAVRQAARLASNLLASIRGEPVVAYRHANAGAVASLGLHKGVAEIYGVRLRRVLAWFLHRTYHVSRVPTFNRKARIVADWTLALFFRRDIVALGALHAPRTAFVRASSRRDGSS